MKKTLFAGAVLVGILLTTAGSCSANDDRSSGSGQEADAHADTTKVTVYHNADDVPNVAVFCVGNFRFASTLSGGDADTAKQPQLVRLPEEDALCSGKAQ